MSAELSFNKGKRLVKVVESKNPAENGTEIYLYQPDFKCCLNCSNKCNYKKHCCASCASLTYHNKEHKNKNPINEAMSIEQITKLIKMIKDDDDDENIDNFIESESASGSGLKGSNISKSKIILKSGKFQVIPSSVYGDPSTILLCGRAGSGKTFWLAEYLREFKLYYPKYRIYLLSQKVDDKLIDPLISKRIPLDSLKDANFEAEDFKESMFIADDVDVISDKATEKATFDLISKVLEVGRSYNIFSCLTFHLSANGKQTKRILNRATHYVFFKNSSNHGTDYVLGEYFGFNRKEIQAIHKLEGRSICVIRDCPQIVVSSDTIQFQNELDKI
jgi:chromosomal replication initiation ATPase DnaA